MTRSAGSENVQSLAVEIVRTFNSGNCLPSGDPQT